MTPYERALADLGTREIVGIKHNAAVLQYFTDSGNAWVKDDETAWCAAAMGAWLARSGIKPTGKLNARSYLAWGVPVLASKAVPGDVAVFKRGTSDWEGHVAFFEQFVGDKVQVVGGNQSNSVSRALYPLADLLDIRRASPAAAPQPPHSAPKPVPAPTTPAPAKAPQAGLVTAAAAILAALGFAFWKGH